MTDRAHATIGHAAVENGTLYYEDAGDGDEAIVLIHGNAGDRRHWDRQFDTLAENHRVIRYDVRGFGRSPPPAGDCPYANHEDLAALLDALGLRSAHIVGWSMGSAIAADFVLAHPARARSLVAVCPWLFGYSSDSARAFVSDLTGIVKAATENGSKAATEAWMNSPFFLATIRNAEAGKEFERIASDCSWWALTHARRLQFLEPGAVARLRQIAVPTLLITAEHDIPTCREIAELMDAELPHSKMLVIPETGHLLQFEKPGELNDRLLQFIASSSAS